MKIKILLPVCLCILWNTFFLSAQNRSVVLQGSLANPDGIPVDYATVLLRPVSDTLKYFGCTSDADGRFSVKAPAGEYLLQVSFLGYAPLQRKVLLDDSQDLGTLTMIPAAAEMDAVVVRADMINREGDRFVVRVGDSPIAAGKTAKEMLDISPMVWIDQDNGITINGKERVQLYVNERVVYESGDDLIRYLNSIKAEDIARIEVIPVGGVEHDASAQGGVIKITLRKQRNDGVSGTVNVRYGTRLNNNPQQYLQPALNINYRRNKVGLYANLAYDRDEYYGHGIARRSNDNGYSLRSIWNQSRRSNDGSVRAGAIYDISPRHSVGIEADFAGDFPRKETQNVVDTVFYDKALQGNIESGYSYMRKNRSWNVSANYVARLDTVGSTFKLLLDYAGTHPRSDGNVDVGHFEKGDYEYRSNDESENDLYSLAGDFDIRAGSKSRVKAGFKYMFSKVDSWMKHEYLVGNEWVIRPNQTYGMVYDEHITAAYGSYAYTFGNKINVGAGLRVEHTYAMPAAAGVNNIERQNYFSFFPQANMTLPLGDKHQIIFNYARKIRRPSFWLLVPMRRPVSETEVSVGNPKLKPSFSHEFKLDWVMNRKYTVSAGAYLMNRVWVSNTIVDPDDPMSLICTPENQKNSSMWYVSVSAPVQLASWWNMNVNMVGSLAWYYIEQYRKTNHRLTGNIVNTFTLGGKTSMVVSVYGNTRNRSEYTEYAGSCYVNAGLSRSFLKGAMVLTAQVNDVFNTRNSWRSVYHPNFFEESFFWGHRPMLVVSMQYKFKTGKDFSARRVESGADVSRISGKAN